jgi:hypothetical protein
VSSPGKLQGFPANVSQFVDASGNILTIWLYLLQTLWKRTGTAQGGTSAPTGSIQAFAGPEASIPAGWLLCDGSAISRIDYAALFTVISTYWGVGNGSTTFNIPNMQNRVPVGATPLAFASRGGAILTTGGTIGYAAVNWIIKQ